MPRNGSGTYTPPAGQPVVSGTTVLASTFNALVADVGTELTRSISTDGQTPMAASLPMGGNKITGLAAATQPSDAVRFDQLGNSSSKVNVSDLAASAGSSLMGFIQAAAGAVATTVQDALRSVPVQVSSFGVIGAGNDRTIVQAAVNFCKNGRILDFGNLACDFGTIAAGQSAILIDSPVGMRIIGHGALIQCVCTSGRASVFGVKNPVDFAVDGLTFTQPGYDISSTGGTSSSANGVYGFYLYAMAPYTAAAPCGNVRINGVAHDCAGFVTVDSTNQLGITGAVALAMRDVRVSGQCTRVYYGASSIYGAVDYVVDLVCQDVRRGFISYGQQRAKIDLSLNCSAGFVGSNAFVELACEGQTFGNVSDIDVRVRVTGVEAHDNIVNFYHQQSGVTGSIGNVKARVTFDYVTTTGKSGLVATTAAYCFLHEDPVTANAITPTTRLSENLDLDCDVLGAISGPRVRLSSVPQTLSPISLGRGVTDGLVDFGLWQAFKVRRGALTLPFTPVAAGRTTAGTATYSLQKGSLSVVDGVASFAISLSWTVHTGTGNLYVTPLPLKAISSATIGNPVPACLGTGFGVAGSQIHALLTGQGDEFTVYSKDPTLNAVGFVAVPAAGSIYLSGSIPLYN